MHVRLLTTTLNESLSMPALAKGCKEMEVDSFLILDDLDSSDNTEEAAYREFAAVGIPGKVLKGKFDTLSAKRNYLLNCPEASEGLTTDAYWFIPQADEPPVGPLDRSHMTQPVVMLIVSEMTEDADETHVPVVVEWEMPCFVKVGTPCRWEGEVHELLLFEEGVVADRLSSPRIHRYGSNATIEMREYQAKVLEDEIAEDDTPRANFYLAQTYQNLGRIDDAVAMYLHRATMDNGYDQEQFIALYRAGQLLETTDPFKAARAFMDAWSLRPNRKEPLFHLAHIMNWMGNHEAALMFCNQALMMPATTDSMFVERWVEAWGIIYQWTVAAWWCGIPECYGMMDTLLTRTDIPKEHRANIETNRALPPRAELEAQQPTADGPHVGGTYRRKEQ